VIALFALAVAIVALAHTAPLPFLLEAFRIAGWRSGEMYIGLAKAGYRLAGWSWGMWDFDWGRKRDADRLAARLGSKASDGDIIVIHDGHHKDARADRRHAAETVRRLVPALTARGFAFKPLC
jgi:peptidoglycan/xylan/chitin deacetylase (PgdA/CDA1 family)